MKALDTTRRRLGGPGVPHTFERVKRETPLRTAPGGETNTQKKPTRAVLKNPVDGQGTGNLYKSYCESDRGKGRKNKRGVGGGGEKGARGGKKKKSGGTWRGKKKNTTTQSTGRFRDPKKKK